MTDANGQWFYVCSDEVNINDYVPRTPVITVVPRVTTANIGDIVTFDYSIAGIDEYSYLKAAMIIQTGEDEWQSAGTNDIRLTSLTGSFEFEIKYGYALYAQVSVTDTNGQWFYASSAEIPVTNEQKIYVFPADLTIIDSEAFAGIGVVDGVVIPDGIVSIADDAFGNRDSLVVYGKPSFRLSKGNKRPLFLSCLFTCACAAGPVYGKILQLKRQYDFSKWRMSLPMDPLKWLKDLAQAHSDVGGVHRFDHFYRCMDCDHVWIGPCYSPCKKCRSTNVTECSEIVYNNIKNHNC